MGGALKVESEHVDGRRVRKLWTARVLFLLLAAALGAVVFEERRQQERESEAHERISGPAGAAEAIDLQVDGDAQPRAFSTTLYLHWSAERRPHPGSR
jgi:hypothetical protein